MLNHKKLVSIIASVAFCLSFLASALIVPEPAVAAGTISVLTVPTVFSETTSSLGTVKVSVPAGSIASGDMIIFTLPDNCTFGSAVSIGNTVYSDNYVLVPQYNGMDPNSLYQKLDVAIGTGKVGDNEVYIIATANQALINDGIFYLSLGAIDIDDVDGDLTATFNGPISGFPKGNIIVGRAVHHEVMLFVSGINTSNDDFNSMLRINEVYAGSLTLGDETLKLTLPDGIEWDPAIDADDKNTTVSSDGDTRWGEDIQFDVNVNDKELTIDFDGVYSAGALVDSDPSTAGIQPRGTNVTSAWEIPFSFSIVDETSVNSGDIIADITGGSNTIPSQLLVGRTIGVDGVTLGQPIILTVGGRPFTLIAIVTPADAKNKAVIWSSSNEAIATVVNGVVTPMAAGSAVITVTTVDGGKTASCLVVVNAATGGGGGSSSSTGSSSTSNGGAVIIDGSTISNTVTRQYDSGNNKETFTVNSTINTALAKALASGEESLEIKVTSTHSASTTIVTVPNDVLKAAEGLTLQITTPKASIQIPAGLLEALAAMGQELTMEVGRGKVADINQAMVGVTGVEGSEVLGTPTVINTVLAGNTEVTIPLTGISIPSSATERQEFLDSLGVFVVHDDGETQLIKPSIVFNANGPAVSFFVDRFSTFAIVELANSQPTGLKDISNHWAKDNIDALVEMGVITGYEDGTFRPEQNISRAEFVTILMKTFSLSTQSGKIFGDTQNHWAKQFISTAYFNNVVIGYSDLVFAPDNMITREQMAVMIARTGKLAAQQGTLDFSDDTSVSVWAREAVLAANKAGVISGYPDNTFRPQAYATRAEAVTVVLEAIR